MEKDRALSLMYHKSVFCEVSQGYLSVCCVKCGESVQCAVCNVQCAPMKRKLFDYRVQEI